MSGLLVDRVAAALAAPVVADPGRALWRRHRELVRAAVADAVAEHVPPGTGLVQVRDHALRRALTDPCGRRRSVEATAGFAWSPPLAARRLGRRALLERAARPAERLPAAVDRAVDSTAGRLAEWLDELTPGARFEVHAQALAWAATTLAHLPLDRPGVRVLPFDPAVRPSGGRRGDDLLVVPRIDLVADGPRARSLVVVDQRTGPLEPHLALARLALAWTAAPLLDVGRADRVVLVRTATGDVHVVERAELEPEALALEVRHALVQVLPALVAAEAPTPATHVAPAVPGPSCRHCPVAPSCAAAATLVGRS